MIIERVFRWVEMVGVTALLTVAIKPTSPVLSGVVGLAFGGCAGFYLIWPIIENMDPTFSGRWDRKPLLMTSGAFLCAIASALTTGLLGTAIERAIAAH